MIVALDGLPRVALDGLPRESIPLSTGNFPETSQSGRIGIKESGRDDKGSPESSRRIEVIEEDDAEDVTNSYITAPISKSQD